MEKIIIGRSMTEMLGVLAVIGVLSIAGLAGFKLAMTYYKANETIHDVMLRASNVPMKWDDYENKVDYKYPFPELLPEEQNAVNYHVETWAEPASSAYAYRIEVTGMPNEVCRRIVGMDPPAITLYKAGLTISRTAPNAVKDDCGDGTTNMYFFFEKGWFEPGHIPNPNPNPNPDPNPESCTTDAQCTAGECCRNSACTTDCGVVPPDPDCSNEPSECIGCETESFDENNCRVCTSAIVQKTTGECCDETTDCCSLNDATCEAQCVPDANATCCATGETKCGTVCCSSGSSCVEESCCPTAQVCGTSCCPEGVACIGSKCACITDADCGTDENPCMKCVDGECKMQGALVRAQPNSNLECCEGLKAAYFAQTKGGSCDDSCFDATPNQITINGISYGVGNTCCPAFSEFAGTPNVSICTSGCLESKTGAPAINRDGNPYCCDSLSNDICSVAGLFPLTGQVASSCCPQGSVPYYNRTVCPGNPINGVNGCPDKVNYGSIYCCGGGAVLVSPVAGGLGGEVHCCAPDEKAYFNGSWNYCCKGTVFSHYEDNTGYDCCPTGRGVGAQPNWKWCCEEDKPKAFSLGGAYSVCCPSDSVGVYNIRKCSRGNENETEYCYGNCCPAGHHVIKWSAEMSSISEDGDCSMETFSGTDCCPEGQNYYPGGLDCDGEEINYYKDYYECDDDPENCWYPASGCH